MKRFALTSLAFALVASSLSFAQMDMGAKKDDKSKRPSPPASAQCKFADGKTISVDYSSPRAKGRKIFGGLVPFGQEWRTGANEATTFVTTANLTIGGAAVPAGKYTLYTIPGEKGWKMMINKQTGQWGTEYDAQQNLLQADMTVSAVDAVENFTISFHEMGQGCHLYVDWEKTRATIEISEK
jgi:Protein of unknown function (DUF2911)